MFFGLLSRNAHLVSNPAAVPLPDYLCTDRREFFNDDVNTYNTRIHQFPEVLAAILMRLKPREMFKLTDDPHIE
jgi:hypothetical protein